MMRQLLQFAQVFITERLDSFLEVFSVHIFITFCLSELRSSINHSLITIIFNVVGWRGLKVSWLANIFP